MLLVLVHARSPDEAGADDDSTSAHEAHASLVEREVLENRMLVSAVCDRSRKKQWRVEASREKKTEKK